MKAKSALIASIAFVGIAHSANAQDYTSTGGPTAINGGPHIIDIVITDTGLIQDLNVSLNWASHAWIGDINASLMHVNTGTTVNLMGLVGGPPSGDSSNLQGIYTFDDESANSLWVAAANAATSNDIVAPGTYYATAVGSDTQTFLSAFDGENIQGTWRLTIVDTYPAFSTGSLNNFTVHMTIPAPGALALLGLAGATGIGRRRKRD